MAEFCRREGWSKDRVYPQQSQTEKRTTRGWMHRTKKEKEKRGWIWWKKVSGLLIHLPAEWQRLATLKLGFIVRVHACPGGGRNSKIFGRKKQIQHRHFKKKSLPVNRFLIRIQGNIQIFQLFFFSRLKRLNINDAGTELVCHSRLGGINCKTSLNMQYLCISF